MVNSTMVEANTHNELDEFKREDYQTVLTAISEDIVIDNILDQIDKSLDIETLNEKQSLFNYLDIRIQNLLAHYTVETDEYAEVVQHIDGVLNTISKRIESTFKFDIEYSEVIDIEKKLNYVRSMYQFFTINIYDNILKLTDKFIKTNIDAYAEELNGVDREERKNLSYKFIQNDIDNQYTSVVYYTKNIIDTLDFPTDMYAEDVFEVIVEDDLGEVTNNHISRMFIDSEWVEINYLEPITNVLIEAIHGNDQLIKDIKISLVTKYKDVKGER